MLKKAKCLKMWTGCFQELLVKLFTTMKKASETQIHENPLQLLAESVLPTLTSRRRLPAYLEFAFVSYEMPPKEFVFCCVQRAIIKWDARECKFEMMQSRFLTDLRPNESITKKELKNEQSCSWSTNHDMLNPKWFILFRKKSLYFMISYL